MKKSSMKIGNQNLKELVLSQVEYSDGSTYFNFEKRSNIRSKEIYSKDNEDKQITNWIKKFRKLSMGRKDQCIKTPGEFSELLYKTGIVDSIEEGRKLIPNLVGGKIKSPNEISVCLFGYYNGLSIEPVKDKNNINYLIGIFHTSCPF